MFGVLGLGNVLIPGDFQTTFNIHANDADKTKIPELKAYDNGYPGAEYYHVHLFFGNLFSTIRLSMGDFGAIDAAQYLSKEDIWIFWIIWFINVIVTCVIFLNFIVAEASESYA